MSPLFISYCTNLLLLSKTVILTTVRLHFTSHLKTEIFEQFYFLILLEKDDYNTSDQKMDYKQYKD